MPDLLISNGLIIDGTGSPGYHGTVVIEGDAVSIVRGDLPTEMEFMREIDASGRVVCPGFVDLHSHTGLTILGAPHHDPKVRQGVTTELVGIDGISHAPFSSPEELKRYIWLDSGLNGYPPSADWLSVPEYLDQFDQTVAINMAYILGNSPVRIVGVGWGARRASKRELENMKAVVRESMEAGAWGLSSGLDYPPGAFADTDELVALAEVAARMGGFYHTHTRSSLKSKGILAPWEEAVSIGRRSGIAVHLTHYRQSAQGDGSHLDYLGLVESARSDGLDVTFDCYAYPYLGSSATFYLPHWTKDGGPERLIEVLTSPDERSRMKSDMESTLDVEQWSKSNWLTNFLAEDDRPYDGKSIFEIAAMRSQHPIDALADLMLTENLGVSVVGLGTNQHTLSAFVSHPYGMIASDAILLGEFPSPRSYGNFPIVLAEFVRAEKHLRLPEAIRKMTSFPAQRLGLPDRGILRDGFKADVVVFDPDGVNAPATKDRPKQYPIGIDYVIVNGEIVVESGQNTGALPGRSLRRGRN